jgi:hypothetical protein
MGATFPVAFLTPNGVRHEAHVNNTDYVLQVKQFQIDTKSGLPGGKGIWKGVEVQPGQTFEFLDIQPGAVLQISME